MTPEILSDLAFILPRTAACLAAGLLIIHAIKPRPRRKHED